MKRFSKNILIALIGILGVGALSGCDAFIKTNKGKVDLNWYTNITYENEKGQDIAYTSSNGDVAAVAFKDAYDGSYGIVNKKDMYVDVKSVQDQIDDRLYYDPNDNVILFTDAQKTYKISNKNNYIYCSDEDGYFGDTMTCPVGEENKSEVISYKPYIIEKDRCLVNTKLMEKFIEVSAKLIPKTSQGPAVISLDYGTDKKVQYTLDDEIEIRTKGNYQNLIVKTAKEDSKVTMIAYGENWSKIKTEDGVIGFVPTKYLDDKEVKKSKFKSDDKTYKHISLNKKVTMVWSPIYAAAANGNLASNIRDVKGVNVISPTWFRIKDKSGALHSLADHDYVAKAHKNGMKVWALVGDIESPKTSNYVLSRTSTRRKLVNSIISEVEEHNIDGINVDYENVNLETGRAFRQFLRELSALCRVKKITLSIDNYQTSREDTYYDLKQQAKLADYIVIMNYDEHNAGSKEPGSVSSLGFAEEGIQSMVRIVGDSKRIINANPFYTRLWDMVPEGKGSNKGTFIEDSVNGNYYLSSQVLDMATAKKAYTKAKANPVWDKTTGQNYVTWEVGSTTRQMWLEDSKSMESRMKLASKYDLAGSAFWALGMEDSQIWKIINK